MIVLKNRAAIYQREAAEMLHNISLYPGLTEEQLCRFFPEKEATAKTLLAHMLKEGRIFCAENGRYYANQEAQNGADKDLSRCVWVLLDFIDQVEYHTVGEFPAAILCFANGELYEIVPIPQGKESMICLSESICFVKDSIFRKCRSLLFLMLTKKDSSAPTVH